MSEKYKFTNIQLQIFSSVSCLLCVTKAKQEQKETK